jgi:alcohol dehydrogenase class IV
VTSGVGEPIPPFELGRLPRVRFGAERLAEAPAVAARHGHRALLVTGAASFRGTPHHARLLEGLVAQAVAVVGEVVVRGEPSPEDVDEPVAEHRGAGVDVVLAVGGGSALDAGKAIAGLLRTGTSVLDHLEGVGRGLVYPGPAVPLVAVPTTAGTGSEATRNAVISRRDSDGFKRSFRDERLVPADAVIDPDLLAGAPPNLVAANGMDAVTQLLESYVSSGASPVTDALALAGLRAARDALLEWHADPDGPAAPAARSRMAWAAFLSGVCLAHAGLGAVHGLASPLGALLPIPHGVACGAVLAPVVRANVRALSERAPGSPALARYAELGRLLADLPEATPDAEARGTLADTLEAWARRLGLPGLAAHGLAEEAVGDVVAGSRGGSMRTNPVELTDEELDEVLRASL